MTRTETGKEWMAAQARSGYQKKSRRHGAAFWLDWAPIVLLGLSAALAGAWQLGESVMTGQPAPMVIVQKAAPAQVRVTAKPAGPTTTAQAPAASRGTDTREF